MEEKDYLTEARKYTKRNLYRTKDYKQFKNNDYYHIEKFTIHLWNELQKKDIKTYNKIVKEFNKAVETFKKNNYE